MTEKKAVELLLCDTSTVFGENKIYTHIWVMNYELCKFSDLHTS